MGFSCSLEFLFLFAIPWARALKSLLFGQFTKGLIESLACIMVCIKGAKERAP